jgi:hypothetical protein
LFCLAAKAQYELASANKSNIEVKLTQMQIIEATTFAENWQTGQPLPLP